MKRITSWITPKYSELTAYQAAVIFIALMLTKPDLRVSILITLARAEDFYVLIFWLLLFSIFGLCLSLWHVFTSRNKTVFEKYFMGIFLMVINGSAGLIAGIEILPSQWSIFSIFPIWNIIWSVLLLYQVFIVDNVIADENAYPIEVLVATITVVILLYITNEIMNLSWAMAFSICIFYASLNTLLVTRMINLFQDRKFR